MALGQNIKKARTAKKLSQDDLSALTGGLVSQGAISALEKRDSSTSEHAPALAKALGVSLEELITGEIKNSQKSQRFSAEEPVTEYGNIGEKMPLGWRVPLISYVAAGNWSEAMDIFQTGIAEDWLPCPEKHSNKTFALKVRGVSMFASGAEESYSEGDVIYVDPEIPYKHRDLVIAKLEDSQEATFKRLLIDGESMFLEALNEDWKPRYQQINGNCTIVGVVIGSYRSRKR